MTESLRTKKLSVIGQIPLSSAHLKRLQSLGQTFIADSNPPSKSDTAEILRRIGDSEAILTTIAAPISADIIERAPQLRFIQCWSTGTDHIDLKAAQKAGITVANVPDFSTESVAERTLTLMLIAASPILEANQSARQGRWEFTKFRGRELRGKSLLIIGGGRIGKRVQELARAFGMSTQICSSRTSQDELHGMLSGADFVSLHCPSTQATRKLINATTLSKTRRGAILINTARGDLVDETALLSSLEDGTLAFACLDVLSVEPPTPGSSLLNHPKTFVTPHSAWNTQEALDSLSTSALNNLENYFLGKPVLSVLE